jgi:hypothetical protein
MRWIILDQNMLDKVEFPFGVERTGNLKTLNAQRLTFNAE